LVYISAVIVIIKVEYILMVGGKRKNVKRYPFRYLIVLAPKVTLHQGIAYTVSHKVLNLVFA